MKSLLEKVEGRLIVQLPPLIRLSYFLTGGKIQCVENISLRGYVHTHTLYYNTHTRANTYLEILVHKRKTNQLTSN